MVGDSYGQAFDDFAAARLQLRRVTTSAEAFDLVSSGQADYLLYSLYAGDDYLKKTGAASQFESLPKFVNEENFYITISKKSPYVSYLPLLNQEIAKYKADGTIAALIAEYRDKRRQPIRCQRRYHLKEKMGVTVLPHGVLLGSPTL